MEATSNYGLTNRILHIRILYGSTYFKLCSYFLEYIRSLQGERGISLGDSHAVCPSIQGAAL
jgi:hypothetical protein